MAEITDYIVIMIVDTSITDYFMVIILTLNKITLKLYKLFPVINRTPVKVFKINEIKFYDALSIEWFTQQFCNYSDNL